MASENTHEQIIAALQALRQYALEQTAGQGIAVGLDYHEEDSALVRFANSAVSLNTSEHLVRLTITACQDRRRASCQLITHLERMDEMQRGIDTALELVQHAQPLNYQPTIPTYTENFSDESAWDPALAQISNAERLEHFNQAVAGLESDEIVASGIFSSGATTRAMLYTTSEHSQFFRLSDAQVIAVLTHRRLKWEAIAEGSAQRKTDLDSTRINHDLATLVEHYQNDTPQQLPLGRYNIVFGPAATAEMLSMMNYIGFDGGIMKRGYSFLSEAQIGQRVFSEQFNLYDDPARRETYPFRRDFTGLPRQRCPVFAGGVFQGFTWQQDDADEFGARPTGHSVDHLSLALEGGTQDGAGSLQELLALPRESDLLYIPYLHYMNIVNPSKALITASSRFGALLLRADGTVGVPYNVRLTQSLLDIFGERLARLSRQTVAYNTSQSYGRRDPTAAIVPVCVRVIDLEISHANAAY